jgi:hypothetical protein
MKRFGKMFGSTAILATAALFAGPSAARAGEGEPREDLRSELRRLQDQINVLRKLGDLESRRNEMELRLINDRLERIERALARMTAGPLRSESRFEPSDPAPAGAGTLRLTNRLPVTTFVRVNGVRYSVPPFATRAILNVPAGPLTYEVSARGYYARATTMSNIGDGETLTVNINAPAPALVFP